MRPRSSVWTPSIAQLAARVLRRPRCICQWIGAPIDATISYISASNRKERIYRYIGQKCNANYYSSVGTSQEQTVIWVTVTDTRTLWASERMGELSALLNALCRD